MTDDGYAGMIDAERWRSLVEIGLSVHPDPERVRRFLASGATFFARHRDGDIEVSLQHVEETAPALSCMRTHADEPVPIDPADLGERCPVVTAPVDTVRPKPQG